VIETSPGRGSFVRANGTVGEARRAVADIALGALEAAIRDAKSLGLERGQVEELFARSIARWYPTEENA
jgi:DNA-binding transcriptional regulator YhcF (GntR family)